MQSDLNAGGAGFVMKPTAAPGLAQNKVQTGKVTLKTKTR